MGGHHQQRKLSFLVWSKYQPEEGRRIVPSFPNSPDKTDWFQFTPFEAQVVAEACAQCPDRYSQNLADTINHSLRSLDRTDRTGPTFP